MVNSPEPQRQRIFHLGQRFPQVGEQHLSDTESRTGPSWRSRENLYCVPGQDRRCLSLSCWAWAWLHLYQRNEKLEFTLTRTESIGRFISISKSEG